MGGEGGVRQAKDCGLLSAAQGVLRTEWVGLLTEIFPRDKQGPCPSLQPFHHLEESLLLPG